MVRAQTGVDVPIPTLVFKPALGVVEPIPKKPLSFTVRAAVVEVAKVEGDEVAR